MVGQSRSRYYTLRSLHYSVHPKFYASLASPIELVRYCSNAYRHNVLRNCHVFPQRATDDLGLSLTNADANTLLCNYFSNIYTCTDIHQDSGFLLLKCAVQYVKSPLTLAAVAADCNLQWLHLLTCLFLPATARVNDMHPQEQASALVAINPRSFSKDELREQYPTLLIAPGYLLLEYLQHTLMTSHLYGLSSLWSLASQDDGKYYRYFAGLIRWRQCRSFAII